MADIIQKAVEYDKVSATLRKQHRRAEDLTDAGNYCWQPKYDGIHCIIDTTNCCAFTREGTALPSIQHVVDYLSAALGTGLVFQGEVWMPGVAFKDISGAARRQSLQLHLGVVLYDVHAATAFYEGRDYSPYRVRRGDLARLLAFVSGNPRILLAESYPATPDCRPIGGWQLVAQDFVRRGGFDGLILRDLDAPWVAGVARQGELIKVKPSVTLDLRCNGVIQGEGKHAGKLGALSVSFNGVNSCVGTGFSDEEREAYWKGATTRDPDYFNPIGAIVEVEAMCVNPNGTLREPRFKCIRWDKSKADDDKG